MSEPSNWKPPKPRSKLPLTAGEIAFAAMLKKYKPDGTPVSKNPCDTCERGKCNFPYCEVS